MLSWFCFRVSGDGGLGRTIYHPLYGKRRREVEIGADRAFKGVNGRQAPVPAKAGIINC